MCTTVVFPSLLPLHLSARRFGKLSAPQHGLYSQCLRSANLTTNKRPTATTPLAIFSVRAYSQSRNLTAARNNLQGKGITHGTLCRRAGRCRSQHRDFSKAAVLTAVHDAHKHRSFTVLRVPCVVSSLGSRPGWATTSPDWPQGSAALRYCFATVEAALLEAIKQEGCLNMDELSAESRITDR